MFGHKIISKGTYTLRQVRRELAKLKKWIPQNDK